MMRNLLKFRKKATLGLFLLLAIFLQGKGCHGQLYFRGEMAKAILTAIQGSPLSFDRISYLFPDNLARAKNQPSLFRMMEKKEIEELKSMFESNPNNPKLNFSSLQKGHLYIRIYQFDPNQWEPFWEKYKKNPHTITEEDICNLYSQAEDEFDEIIDNRYYQDFINPDFAFENDKEKEVLSCFQKYLFDFPDFEEPQQKEIPWLIIGGVGLSVLLSLLAGCYCYVKQNPSEKKAKHPQQKIKIKKRRSLIKRKSDPLKKKKMMKKKHLEEKEGAVGTLKNEQKEISKSQSLFP